MLELAICFVMTVCMLRGFFLEGYLVSTGSMAPVLLGFHKQIECPMCQHEFAFGVRFDESVGEGSVAANSADPGDARATCPNCGQININTSDVPRNHGDQLLVHKSIFDFRAPCRWEPVVFRNPASPGEAYVKRVVGLPGEEIQISGGDVYVNGQIARKDFGTQREMRILVSDVSHVPDSEEWELPWQLEGKWEVTNGQLTCLGESGSREPNTLAFRHWRWFGGRHIVEAPLSPDDAYPDWMDFLERYQRIPISWTSQLEYDEEAQLLRCRGVMPADLQRDLMTSATNERFRRAIYRLAALSHLAPVTDSYGYNSSVSSAEYGVQDLMLDVVVQLDAGQPDIKIDFPVARQLWQVMLDTRTGLVELAQDGDDTEIRSGQIPPGGSELEIEVSNFDRRLLVAVNGELVFAPVDLPGQYVSSPDSADSSGLSTVSMSSASTARHLLRQNQLRMNLYGATCRLTRLRLYRDVYYTPGQRKNAVDSVCRIAGNSYFVQGDNSPVSFDSRSWDNPLVPHELLVGKPFVVHLPSRPGRLKFAGRELTIRLPDFSRIRYIP